MRRLSDGRLELKLSYPGNGYFLETHWTQDKNPVTMWIERAYAADPDDDELEVGERKRARKTARTRADPAEIGVVVRHAELALPDHVELPR